ncbi:RND family transporter [Segniliparus rugosus]|uniref:Membrane transport protein MMPL domain-containing protein n=1 Tax=Segniliparus rugosus (strain ATCC BAA-974 / DSM 45345 / CCUG 50838 / CIP 108380 / JCM 13579 / CDC 945) TaxID=679197 RepID=E5XMN9_SEGRC|nr:RND family transporter [Segniliparus rugosus]EFV14384.1 hypothetical protein HMPREF9336_00759 [Segniliparus rugosus ATCC BAA-974]
MWTRLASFCSRYAILVVGLWLLAAGAGNLLVPQLEPVSQTHARSFFPSDTPILHTTAKIGQLFGDGDTINLNYLVLEDDRPLDETARSYYDRLVGALRADSAHVQSVQDLWADPITAKVGVSADGKAVYAMVRLTGDVGSGQANEAIEAVRTIVASNPPPGGIHAHITGPATTITDEFDAIDRQMLMITGATIVLITLLLIAVYRSPLTALIPLTAVGLGLAVARPIVAFLGMHDIIEVSIFSVALLAALMLGATTDYGIFLLGRYHEERRRGVAHAEALGAANSQVGPVVLASGLTIAAGLSCLVFGKINMLRTAGLPCAIGILVGMASSLTVLPALIGFFGSRGWAQPRAAKASRRWRRIGTAVARWPGPVASVAVLALVVCALPVLGLDRGYVEAAAIPETTPSNRGYQAMDRHFPPNSILPEVVVLQSDHDMRNPQGLIALEKVARSVMAVPGVRMVQSASRPGGTVPAQAQLSDQAGVIGGRLDEQMAGLSERLASLDRLQSALSGFSSAIAKLQAGLDGSVTGLRQVNGGADGMRAGMEQLQDNANTVSGYLDPLRDIVNGNPNCANDGICSVVMKVVEPMDGMVEAAETLAKGSAVLGAGSGDMAKSLAGAASSTQSMRASLGQLDAVSTQLSQAIGSIRPMFAGLTDYLQELSADFAGSGEGGFYLPQRAWDDPTFRQASAFFFSKDGKAARFLVFEDGDVFGPDGADRAPRILSAIHEATKEGTLVGNTTSMVGYGIGTAQMRDFVEQDFLLLAVVSLTMIFLIMLVMLRSPVAAAAVIGTVILSYLSALGVSTLIWQDIIGREVHWSVPSIAMIALVSVGADYNLLFALRMREEVEAHRGKRDGLRTGMIRAFGGTGGVVTTAGIVFGITMFAMLSSDVLSIEEVGTTIGVGLLIDTLIVRTFVVPGIASLLGRWFWWPLRFNGAGAGHAAEPRAAA